MEAADLRGRFEDLVREKREVEQLLSRLVEQRDDLTERITRACAYKDALIQHLDYLGHVDDLGALLSDGWQQPLASKVDSHRLLCQGCGTTTDYDRATHKLADAITVFRAAHEDCAP